MVSFKLETEDNLLIPKARDALNKYKHNVSNINEILVLFNYIKENLKLIFFIHWNIFLQLVIANVLHTRKQKVIIVSQEDIYIISLTNEQLNKGEEIEQLIVNNLIEKHQIFIQSTEQCECWWTFGLCILNW